MNYLNGNFLFEVGSYGVPMSERNVFRIVYTFGQ